MKKIVFATNNAHKLQELRQMIGEHYAVGYARFTDDAATFVVVNTAKEEKTVAVPVWEAITVIGTTFERVLLTDSNGYSTEVEELKVEGRKLKLTLPPVSAIIVRTKRAGATDKEE